MVSVLTLSSLGLFIMLLTVNIMIHPCKTKNLTDMLSSSLLYSASSPLLLLNMDMSLYSLPMDHTYLTYVLSAIHISFSNSLITLIFYSHVYTNCSFYLSSISLSTHNYSSLMSLLYIHTIKNLSYHYNIYPVM